MSGAGFLDELKQRGLFANVTDEEGLAAFENPEQTARDELLRACDACPVDAISVWDAEGRRTLETVARPASAIAERAGFSLPEGAKFIIVREDKIGRKHPFSGEKLTPVLAIFRYSGFDNALDMVDCILDVGGKGHSCGIYSFNDDHIHQLAMVAPVERVARELLDPVGP